MVNVGGTSFLLQPWRDTAYSRPANWYFHCKVCIERLPLHAWCEDGVRQALGDFCAFDYIEPISFTQENTEKLYCWVWMWNPDLLPRSKLTTIFPEGVGRSRPGVTAAPPEGDMVDLIIHLGYFDWSPPPASRTLSSRGSGLPSLTSSDSDGRSFPFFKDFTWYAGLLDGRLPRSGLPRMANTACRGGPSTRRDRDHHDDDDERRGPRRHWSEHISARGRSVDDLPLQGGGQTDRFRSRSPAHHGRRHDEGIHNLESRGRYGMRSPPSPSRFRDPACRDDEGWDCRRSRSPVRAWSGWTHASEGPRALAEERSSKRQDGDVEEEHARYGHGGNRPERARSATGASPPLRHHPDPIIDFLAGLCQDSELSSGREHDPMLMEVAGALSYSPSTSPTGSARYTVSPPYVPVSELWSSGAAGVVQSRQQEGHPAGKESMGQPIGPHMSGVDGLADQVHSMEIDGPSVFEAKDGGPKGGEVEAQHAAREHFFSSVFADVQPAALPTPAPAPMPTPRVQPQRQSERLLTRPSSVPVSRRATHRLMRQLDFVGQDEPIGDEALEKYEKMHYGPMPRKTVAALAAVTRVASKVVMAASAALAADASAAQVEAV
ncbi:unnamed protein product [Urochloa humidicola]